MAIGITAGVVISAGDEILDCFKGSKKVEAKLEEEQLLPEKSTSNNSS